MKPRKSKLSESRTISIEICIEHVFREIIQFDDLIRKLLTLANKVMMMEYICTKFPKYIYSGSKVMETGGIHTLLLPNHNNQADENIYKYLTES